MNEIRNSKPKSLGHLELEFEIYLGFGILEFGSETV